MSENICIVLGCKKIRTTSIISKWCGEHLQELKFPTQPKTSSQATLKSRGGKDGL